MNVLIIILLLISLQMYINLYPYTHVIIFSIIHAIDFPYIFISVYIYYMHVYCVHIYI